MPPLDAQDILDSSPQPRAAPAPSAIPSKRDSSADELLSLGLALSHLSEHARHDPHCVEALSATRELLHRLSEDLSQAARLYDRSVAHLPANSQSAPPTPPSSPTHTAAGTYPPATARRSGVVPGGRRSFASVEGTLSMAAGPSGQARDLLGAVPAFQSPWANDDGVTEVTEMQSMPSDGALRVPDRSLDEELSMVVPAPSEEQSRRRRIRDSAGETLRLPPVQSPNSRSNMLLLAISVILGLGTALYGVVAGSRRSEFQAKALPPSVLAAEFPADTMVPAVEELEITTPVDIFEAAEPKRAKVSLRGARTLWGRIHRPRLMRRLRSALPALTRCVNRSALPADRFALDIRLTGNGAVLWVREFTATGDKAADPCVVRSLSGRGFPRSRQGGRLRADFRVDRP